MAYSGGRSLRQEGICSAAVTSRLESAWLRVALDAVRDDVRADVFWELPNGDLLLEVRDAKAFSSGTGYQVLHPRLQ